MKRPALFMVISGAVFSLVLGGCLSIPNSPNPRFYTLSAIAKAEPQQKLGIPSNVIIGIGPVKIPEYLNRPPDCDPGRQKDAYLW